MKKTVLMVALLAGLGTANAQNLGGRFFIGGDVLGFSSKTGKNEVTNTTTGVTTSTDQPKITSFGIQPTIGYYITDNWAIGAKLGYMNTTTKTVTGTTERKESENLVSVSPFIRYNMPLTDKFAFFVDGGVRFETGTTAVTISSTPAVTTQPLDTKVRNLGVNIGPGFLWFVRDNIAIQGSIGTLLSFNSNRTEDPNPPTKNVNTTNTFGLSLNGGVGLGLYYYFGGNK